MKKSALLLIEFQNEWLSDNGKLHHLITDPQLFETSVKSAKKSLKTAREAGITVIHSGLSFDPDYRALGEAEFGLRSRLKLNQVFIKDQPGSQFHTDFQPKDNELVVAGRMGCSAFSGSNLNDILRYHGIEKLFIMGYALQVCVESTMRQAHDLGFETYLIGDACAAFNQEIQDYALKNASHFAKPIKASKLKEYL